MMMTRISTVKDNKLMPYNDMCNDIERTLFFLYFFFFLSSCLKRHNDEIRNASN